jgi:N-acetylneuraminic acid mutarotase
MKKHYALSLILLICSLLHAQNYTWTQMPSAPFAIYNPATLVLGGNIYLVSGVTNNATSPLGMGQEVWEFNTTANTWSQKNNFPGTAIFGASTFVIGNYGYVVNGWDSTNSGEGPSACWQYDPSGDTWAQKAPFPDITRYTATGFTAAGKGYLACGFGGGFSGNYTNEVFQYDPVANSWAQMNNFPGLARQGAFTFTIDTTVYVGMGTTGDGFGGYFLQSDWYKYQSGSDTWVQLGYFPANAIGGSYPFVLGGNAYLACGDNQNQLNATAGASNQVWEYTPGTDTWAMIGLFPDTPITGGASGAGSGAGSMGVGENHADGVGNLSTYQNVWWRYGPATGATGCAATINELAINNSTFNFQAVGSFSPSAQFTWLFGDGQTGTGISVIHQYATTGSYSVSLVTTDTAGGGCNDSAGATAAVGNLSTCSVSVSSANSGSIYTLIASATGGGPYSYAWTCQQAYNYFSSSPDPLVSLAPNTPATFCVTVTDTSGCSASACETVSYVPDSSSCSTYLYIYPDPNVPGLYWAAVYYTGGTPVSYSWSFGDGGTSTDSFPSYTYQTSGFYYICLSITDSAGCTSSYCDSFFYAYKVGGGPIKQINALRGGSVPVTTLGIAAATEGTVAVYPNPANTSLTIRLGGDKAASAAIYDVAGQQVSEVSAPANNTVDVSALPDGIYFVQVRSNTTNGWAKFVKVNK